LISLENILISSTLYLFLHFKTHIRLKFLLIDNFAVIVLNTITAFLFFKVLENLGIVIFLNLFFVLFFAFVFTMIRFWHTPKRQCRCNSNEIISPADGRIIYIKKIESENIPISIKKNRATKLIELTKTDLLKSSCWLIGINMTLFDVHKNAAPISGKVLLNKHFDGSFFSLKQFESITENERNTIVLQNESATIGIVQTASRLVKRIDTYVKEGENINQGEWLGMIRFGSQVDLIIPANAEIKVKEGDQVFAVQTIIATIKN